MNTMSFVVIGQSEKKNGGKVSGANNPIKSHAVDVVEYR